MRPTYNYNFERDGKIMHSELHTHTAYIVKKFSHVDRMNK